MDWATKMQCKAIAGTINNLVKEERETISGLFNWIKAGGEVTQDQIEKRVLASYDRIINRITNLKESI